MSAIEAGRVVPLSAKFLPRNNRTLKNQHQPDTSCVRNLEKDTSQRPTKTLHVDKPVKATSRTSKWRTGNGGRAVAVRFSHDQPAGQAQCSTSLGGFLLIINDNGEIYYASENIENFLGFHQRIDMRGKLLSLHGLPSSYVLGRSNPGPVMGMIAVCTPFVPPSSTDVLAEDQILKTKHQLDGTLVSMDDK
ncbi:hypothetical protein TELCIR_17699 [Teladorsagia circumcincta]|uniref:PAS domain-containing protein n=1 Tax=Teladorsagia circumcincta TaxID=45464 RepID=A0A2G9TS14_TELCI|nr:hypothetical protein TELCIR_17699 [Teladorsagia circumcincta]